MGEIADMMLDGTLCEQCGEYLDDDGFGVPRKCPSCAAEEKEEKKSGNFFVVKNEKSIELLEGQLPNKKYNIVKSNLKDKKGTPMIGLNLDTGAGKWEKVMLILVSNKALFDKAVEVAEANKLK